MAEGIPMSMDEFYKKLKEVTNYSPDVWLRASDALASFSNEINKTLGQGRQRMIELNQTVADSIPGVVRLGGSIVDVTKTIDGAVLSSRRNVIANSEDVENLFAATKLLGGTAESLSNAFIDVGIGIEEIPTQLEKSMSYVRSIGGNTKQVMEDVRDNMAQMNRFQFENGVQGLTKMAAQASMLRFNMSETFRLADDVLNPERAVEVASAFQRLGVSAGNLVDPFQLMNMSINDPSGLQDSLANVAKQFSYFDEKTKTFKINPQGVLTLKAIQDQTGVSAAELSKMAVAAQEADRRLSAVSAAGLKIANEEDKQFLANIAKIRADGTYEVTLKDGTKKELADLQQTEFDELIDEQRKGPKTLEELARAQLTTSELATNNLDAIRQSIVAGAVSAGGLISAREQMRGVVETTLSEYSKALAAQDVRKESQTLIGNVEQFVKDLKDPNKKGMDAIADFLDKIGGQFESIQKRVGESLLNTTKKIGTIESQKKESGRKLYGETLLKGAEKVEQLTKTSPTTSVFGGDKSELVKGTKSLTTSVTSKSDVNFGGKITVEVALPTNFNSLDKEQQQKILDEIFNSPKFQEMIRNISEKKNPMRPVSTTYTR